MLRSSDRLTRYWVLRITIWNQHTFLSLSLVFYSATIESSKVHLISRTAPIVERCEASLSKHRNLVRISSGNEFCSRATIWRMERQLISGRCISEIGNEETDEFISYSFLLLHLLLLLIFLSHFLVRFRSWRRILPLRAATPRHCKNWTSGVTSMTNDDVITCYSWLLFPEGLERLPTLLMRRCSKLCCQRESSQMWVIVIAIVK